MQLYIDGAWKELTAQETQVYMRETALTRTAAQVRSTRDAMLAACDWTQLPDAPGDRIEWAAYRQALRDITMQEGFPENVIWPQVPDEPAERVL